jgi:lactobin A/cerein 7B family class IIb bacteriocin
MKDGDLRMSTMENPADIRCLTDAELEHVSGGVPMAFAVACLIGPVAALVIGGWDMPPGTTVQQGAAALGVSHIL